VANWGTRPGYLKNPIAHPDTWHWPVLDLGTITCSGGGTGLTHLNPAGVPTLCGAAFETWFETQFPAGTTTLATTADATVDRTDPNTNNGADTRLLLFGGQHRVVVGFDAEALESFRDEEGLERAQLVLSGADESAHGGSAWIQLRPLPGTFVEGNGSQTEELRGDGSGATWNCAADHEIADFAEACLTEWPLRFAHGLGVQVQVPDSYTGTVAFDVTEDVANGISAWVIAHLRGRASVAFQSREGAELLEEPSLAPTLILKGDGEEQVAESAAD
jgi:hypothetical protein